MAEKRLVVYNPYPNKSVTTFYTDVVGDAARKEDFIVFETDIMPKANPTDMILIVHAKDYLQARRRGYQKIFLWVQGITPEESFMRNKSKWRRFVLSLRELPGVRWSDRVFMVSQTMVDFYKNKYRIKNLDERCYVMPCFNTMLQPESFFVPDKYKKNTFTYVGGMAIWQCFEDTVRLYKQVEEKIPDCMFQIYTGEQETAEKIVKKHGIKNYTIAYLPQDELDKALKNIKFGFVIREDNPVNNVATPTKFSNYVGNGIIPIFSDCIRSFYHRTKELDNVIALDDSLSADKICDFCRREIDPRQVLAEFSGIYEDYYNREKYVEDIRQFFRQQER